jgi:hypothetical protein
VAVRRGRSRMEGLYNQVMFQMHSIFIAADLANGA